MGMKWGKNKKISLCDMFSENTFKNNLAKSTKITEMIEKGETLQSDNISLDLLWLKLPRQHLLPDDKGAVHKVCMQSR